MKEKIVITFIALVLGLFITTVVFYIYESTKTKPQIKEKVVSTIAPKTPTPTPTTKIEKLFLTVTDPQNEALVAKNTIQVKGKTNPENSIIVSSNLEDASVNPDSTGAFSVAVALDNGVNLITTRALAPNGEEKTDTRVITYSQEEF